MNIDRKPLAEVTSRAIEVLTRELGPSDTLRFMNQFSRGNGNYSIDRDILFEGVTLDGIIAEIKLARGPQPIESTQSEG